MAETNTRQIFDTAVYLSRNESSRGGVSEMLSRRLNRDQLRGNAELDAGIGLNADGVRVKDFLTVSLIKRMVIRGCVCDWQRG